MATITRFLALAITRAAYPAPPSILSHPHSSPSSLCPSSSRLTSPPFTPFSSSLFLSSSFFYLSLSLFFFALVRNFLRRLVLRITISCFIPFLCSNFFLSLFFFLILVALFYVLFLFLLLGSLMSGIFTFNFQCCR